MFKNLLADRFQLRFHQVTKQGPVYALTVDKAGLKMKRSDDADALKGGVPISGGPLAPGGIVGRGVAMEYLTWRLGLWLEAYGRPVLDETGLDGYYDFNLTYLPELPPNFPQDRLPPDASDRPDIFRALREQLGLRLESQTGPVKTFVIDAVEKPGAN